MIEIVGYDIRYVRTTPKKNKKKVIENELWVVRTEKKFNENKTDGQAKKKKRKNRANINRFGVGVSLRV